MQRPWIWTLAKTLEGVGLVLVLVGLVLSMRYGFRDQGTESMWYELYGLLGGGGLFLLGWLLERSQGTR